MGDNEKIQDATRQVGEDDAKAEHKADRMPTDDEERRAESLTLDPEVKESYEEANERGANAKGEGRIS